MKPTIINPHPAKSLALSPLSGAQAPEQAQHERLIMSTKQRYKEARQAGYSASQALRTAKILVAWDKAEANGLVRLRAEDELENYFDLYGEPEGYTNLHGKRVSAKEERDEIERQIDLYGCLCCISEYFVDGQWRTADSVGMCVGYRDALDWQQNCYVPDLMASALEALNAHKEERLWASESALQTIS